MTFKEDTKAHQRRRRAIRRTGGRERHCEICGENDPRCLEEHEPGSRRYVDDYMIVCSNCHRKLSDMQRDHPASLGREVHELESIGRFLLGLADFLILLAERIRQHGRRLIEQASITLGVTEGERS